MHAVEFLLLSSSLEPAGLSRSPPALKCQDESARLVHAQTTAQSCQHPREHSQLAVPSPTTPRRPCWVRSVPGAEETGPPVGSQEASPPPSEMLAVSTRTEGAGLLGGPLSSWPSASQACPTSCPPGDSPERPPPQLLGGPGSSTQHS